MGSKMRLSSYCTKRGDNTINFETSRKKTSRLARPIIIARQTTTEDIPSKPRRVA